MSTITYKAKNLQQAINRARADGWRVYSYIIRERAYPQKNRLGTYQLQISKVYKKGQIRFV